MPEGKLPLIDPARDPYPPDVQLEFGDKLPPAISKLIGSIDPAVDPLPDEVKPEQPDTKSPIYDPKVLISRNAWLLRDGQARVSPTISASDFARLNRAAIKASSASGTSSPLPFVVDLPSSLPDFHPLAPPAFADAAGKSVAMPTLSGGGGVGLGGAAGTWRRSAGGRIRSRPLWTCQSLKWSVYGNYQ